MALRLVYNRYNGIAKAVAILIAIVSVCSLNSAQVRVAAGPFNCDQNPICKDGEYNEVPRYSVNRCDNPLHWNYTAEDGTIKKYASLFVGTSWPEPSEIDLPEADIPEDGLWIDVKLYFQDYLCPTSTFKGTRISYIHSLKLYDQKDLSFFRFNDNGIVGDRRITRNDSTVDFWSSVAYIDAQVKIGGADGIQAGTTKYISYTYLCGSNWYYANGTTNNGICTYGSPPGSAEYATNYLTIIWKPLSKWTLTPTVSVDKDVAYPGETVTWTHTVKNEGPHSVDDWMATVQYESESTGKLDIRHLNWTYGLASGNTYTGYSSFSPITESDIGKTICRNTTVTPGAYNNSDTVKSNDACVTIQSQWQIPDRCSSDAAVVCPNPDGRGNNYGAASQIKKGTSKLKTTDSGWSHGYINAVSQLYAIAAKPGEYLYWKHDMSSSNKMLEPISWWITTSGGINSVNATWGSKTIQGPKNAQATDKNIFMRASWSNALNIGGTYDYMLYKDDKSTTTSYVTDDDLGNVICEQLHWQASAYNNSDESVTTPACANVPYNYKTAPEVTGADVESTLAGDTVNIGQTLLVEDIQGIIPNESYRTKTPELSVEVTCVMGDGSACEGWSNVVITQSYLTSQVGNIGSITPWQIPIDSPVGTKYCFQAKIAVNGYMIAGGDSGATASNAHCLTVSKSTTLQIHGADSWSGVNCVVDGELQKDEGGFFAKKVSAGSVSASWSQYGLFSIGDIEDGFGSGGRIFNKTGDEGAVLNASRQLKFASGDDDNPSGHFLGASATHCTTDLSSYYGGYLTLEHINFAAGDTIGLSDILIDSDYEKTILGERSVWYGEGDKELNVGTFDPTTTAAAIKDLVLLVDGNITITDNVEIYDGDYTNVTDLPNLVIAVTGNIIIDPTVTRLDGIYSARGIFADCGDTTGLGIQEASEDFDDGGTCKEQLTINGAIISGGNRFQRTNGATDTDDDAAAEIIQYVPAIWLREYSYRQKFTNHVKTILYREVAPRF